MDKYHVYRPLLDLIGFTEGTDKKRGYNETLAYGALTGGNVDLVSKTLKQIDELQGRMLANEANKWNSSALGRYQIVRTTRRNIQKALSIPSTALFDKEMQDRMACYLLGVRGIDKYLAGRLSEDTLLTNLSKEWASLPGPNGKGAYSGQRVAVTADRVRNCLSEVRNRHTKGQPVKHVAVPVEIEKPVAVTPPSLDAPWWQSKEVLGPVVGGGAATSLTALGSIPWQNLLLVLGAFLLLALFLFWRKKVDKAAVAVKAAEIGQ